VTKRNLVLSTRNDHKVREFQRLLPGVALVGLDEGVDLPPEDGDTYAANALGKARAAASVTGLDSIADDSGIEAADLGGAPGIRSARFAGEEATDEENLALLEARVAPGSRLEYVCAIAFVGADGTEKVLEARCQGLMASERSGSRGFGYDPVFVPLAGDGVRTMADLSDAEKDLISHRGLASALLISYLAS
jgi:XTP/dITP diphosphohydrolase